MMQKWGCDVHCISFRQTPQTEVVASNVKVNIRLIIYVSICVRHKICTCQMAMRTTLFPPTSDASFRNPLWYDHIALIQRSHTHIATFAAVATSPAPEMCKIIIHHNLMSAAIPFFGFYIKLRVIIARQMILRFASPRPLFAIVWVLRAAAWVNTTHTTL